jgi:O-antigen chain-terminating methyltransferase
MESLRADLQLLQSDVASSLGPGLAAVEVAEADQEDVIRQLQVSVQNTAAQLTEWFDATAGANDVIGDRLEEVTERVADVVKRVADVVKQGSIVEASTAERFLVIDDQMSRFSDDVQRQLQSITAIEDHMSRFSDDVQRELRSITAIEDHMSQFSDDVQRELRSITAQLDSITKGLHDRLEVVPYMSSDRYERLDSLTDRTVLAFEADGDRPDRGGYLLFEDVFRGSEQMIGDRLSVYLDHIVGDRVVDLGCGRGEMLSILAKAGVSARGIDSDPMMVDLCVEKGLDVVPVDLVSWLSEQPDRSLTTIFSAQVIEHLTFDDMKRMLDDGLRVLDDGGVLIAETVNPHALFAWKTFWVDPTHRVPLFPESMLVLAQAAGFTSGQILFPFGSGDASSDRWTQGEYALIATK